MCPYERAGELAVDVRRNRVDVDAGARQEVSRRLHVVHAPTVVQHDEADLSKKVACPLMTLWGLKGPMGRIYDVLAIWKTKGINVSGKGLNGGHNLQEDVPQEVLAEIRPFLKG